MDDKVLKLLERAVSENLSLSEVESIMLFNGYDQMAIDSALVELKKKRPELVSDVELPSEQTVSMASDLRSDSATVSGQPTSDLQSTPSSEDDGLNQFKKDYREDRAGLNRYADQQIQTAQDLNDSFRDADPDPLNFFESSYQRIKGLASVSAVPGGIPMGLEIGNINEEIERQKQQEIFDQDMEAQKKLREQRLAANAKINDHFGFDYNLFEENEEGILVANKEKRDQFQQYTRGLNNEGEYLRNQIAIEDAIVKEQAKNGLGVFASAFVETTSQPGPFTLGSFATNIMKEISPKGGAFIDQFGMFAESLMSNLAGTGADLLGMDENVAGRMKQQDMEKRAAIQIDAGLDPRDPRTFTEYYEDGDIKKGTLSLGLTLTEQIPQLALTVVAPGYGLSVGAFSAGSASYMDVRNRLDMSVGEKVTTTLISGAAEYLFEKVGMGDVKALRRGLGVDDAIEMATKAEKEAVKKNVLKELRKQTKWKLPKEIAKQGIEEGAEEIGVELTNSALAYLISGETPDPREFVESFLVGAIMGAGSTAGPGILAKGQNSMAAFRQMKEFKTITDEINQLNNELKNNMSPYDRQVKTERLKELGVRQAEIIAISMDLYSAMPKEVQAEMFRIQKEFKAAYDAYGQSENEQTKESHMNTMKRLLKDKSLLEEEYSGEAALALLSDPRKANIKEEYVPEYEDSTEFEGKIIAGNGISESSARALNNIFGVVRGRKKVRVHNNIRSLLNANADARAVARMGGSTPGYYDKATGTIHVLSPEAFRAYNQHRKDKGLTTSNIGKVYQHEVVHPVLEEMMEADPELQNRLYDEIKALEGKDPIADAALKFAEKYASRGESTQKNEAVTEFLALMSQKINIDRMSRENAGMLQRIKDWFNDILAKSGTGVEINSNEDLMTVANNLAQAMRLGSQVVIDGKKAPKKSKPKTRTTKSKTAEIQVKKPKGAKQQLARIQEVLDNNDIDKAVEILAAEGYIETFNGQGIVQIAPGDSEGDQQRDGIYFKINGVVIPMYRSSKGTSGKKPGSWYPFFFLSPNWVVKGGPNFENEYGNDVLQGLVKALNKNWIYKTARSTEEVSEKQQYEMLDIGTYDESNVGKYDPSVHMVIPDVLAKWQKALGPMNLGKINNSVVDPFGYFGNKKNAAWRKEMRDKYKAINEASKKEPSTDFVIEDTLFTLITDEYDPGAMDKDLIKKLEKLFNEEGFEEQLDKLMKDYEDNTVASMAEYLVKFIESNQGYADSPVTVAKVKDLIKQNTERKELVSRSWDRFSDGYMTDEDFLDFLIYHKKELKYQLNLLGPAVQGVYEYNYIQERLNLITASLDVIGYAKRSDKATALTKMDHLAKYDREGMIAETSRSYSTMLDLLNKIKTASESKKDSVLPLLNSPLKDLVKEVESLEPTFEDGSIMPPNYSVWFHNLVYGYETDPDSDRSFYGASINEKDHPILTTIINTQKELKRMNTFSQSLQRFGEVEDGTMRLVYPINPIIDGMYDNINGLLMYVQYGLYKVHKAKDPSVTLDMYFKPMGPYFKVNQQKSFSNKVRLSPLQPSSDPLSQRLFLDSALMKSLDPDTLKMKSGTVDQWMKYFSEQKGALVEAQTIGLRDYLEDYMQNNPEAKSIPYTYIQDFVRANPIEVSVDAPRGIYRWAEAYYDPDSGNVILPNAIGRGSVSQAGIDRGSRENVRNAISQQNAPRLTGVDFDTFVQGHNYTATSVFEVVDFSEDEVDVIVEIEHPNGSSYHANYVISREDLLGSNDVVDFSEDEVNDQILDHLNNLDPEFRWEELRDYQEMITDNDNLVDEDLKVEPASYDSIFVGKGLNPNEAISKAIAMDRLYALGKHSRYSIASEKRDKTIGVAGNNYAEVLIKHPTDFLGQTATFVQSSHFSDENIIVFLRIAEAQTPDGKRVLILDEIQSDWGQGARKREMANNPLIKQQPDMSSRIAAAFKSLNLEEEIEDILFFLDKNRNGENVAGVMMEKIATEHVGDKLLRAMYGVSHSEESISRDDTNTEHLRKIEQKLVKHIESNPIAFAYLLSLHEIQMNSISHDDYVSTGFVEVLKDAGITIQDFFPGGLTPEIKSLLDSASLFLSEFGNDMVAEDFFMSSVFEGKLLSLVADKADSPYRESRPYSARDFIDFLTDGVGRYKRMSYEDFKKSSEESPMIYASGRSIDKTMDSNKDTMADYFKMIHGNVFGEVRSEQSFMLKALSEYVARQERDFTNTNSHPVKNLLADVTLASYAEMAGKVDKGSLLYLSSEYLNIMSLVDALMRQKNGPLIHSRRQLNKGYLKSIKNLLQTKTDIEDLYEIQQLIVNRIESIFNADQISDEGFQHAREMTTKQSKKELTNKLDSLIDKFIDARGPAFAMLADIQRASDEELSDAASDISGLNRTRGGISNKLPFSPFAEKTDRWAGLGMRVATQLAAQGDFDYVAWVPGYFQERRWGAHGKGPAVFYDKVLPKITGKEIKRFDNKNKVAVVNINNRMGDPTGGAFQALGFPITDKTKKFFDEGNATSFTLDTDFAADVPDVTKENPINIINALKFADQSKIATNVEFKEELTKMIHEDPKREEIIEKYGLTLEKGPDGLMHYKMDNALSSYLGDLFELETLVAMKAYPDAIGWYDETVTKAMTVVELMYPEIKGDKDLAAIMKMAIAISSNGLKVKQNFALAVKQYEYFRANGKFNPELVEGTQGGAMTTSFAFINKVLESMSIENFVTFLTTPVKNGEMFYYKVGKNGKKSKQNLTPNYPANYELFGAAVFGPKIGNGFFMNLMGEFQTLTIDRWLTRQFGRLRGDLLIGRNLENTKKADKRFKKAVKALGKRDRKKLTFLSNELTDLNVKMTGRDGEIDWNSIASDISTAASKGANLNLLQSNPKLIELRKAANGLTKYLSGEKESPSTGSERVFMESVFKELQNRLFSKYGISITIADLQAVNWYPEKALYQTFQAKNSISSAKDFTSEEEKPDYFSGASEVAREKGITQKQIDNAIEKLDFRHESVREAVRKGNGQFGTANQEVDLEGIRKAINQVRAGQEVTSTFFHLDDEFTGFTQGSRLGDIEYSSVQPHVKQAKTYLERKMNVNPIMELDGPDVIKTPGDIAFLLRHMESESSESTYLVVRDLDNPENYEVTYMTTGTVNSASVDNIKVRQITTKFQETNGAETRVGITLVHNHPSGNLNVSRADLQMHRKLLEVFENDTAVTVENSVIINLNSGQYSTFDSTSSLGSRDVPYAEYEGPGKREAKKVKVQNFNRQELFKPRTVKDAEIRSSASIPKMLSHFKVSETTKLGVIITNNRLAITRIAVLDAGASAKDLALMLERTVGKYGNRMAFFGNDKAALKAAVIASKKGLAAQQIEIVDAIYVEGGGLYESASDKGYDPGGYGFKANFTLEEVSEEALEGAMSIEESLQVTEMQAEQSPLYRERDLDLPNIDEINNVIKGHKAGKKILDENAPLKEGDLVGGRLNLNLVEAGQKKYGYRMSILSVHKAKNQKSEKYKEHNGVSTFAREKVVRNFDVMTIRNAYFNVNVKGSSEVGAMIMHRFVKGMQSSDVKKIYPTAKNKFPLASIDGEYTETPRENTNFDGVMIKYNPMSSHMFMDVTGRPIKFAEEVTIMGDRAYARGKIVYAETAWDLHAVPGIGVGDFVVPTKVTTDADSIKSSYENMMDSGVQFTIDDSGYESHNIMDEAGMYMRRTAQRFADSLGDSESDVRKKIFENPKNYITPQNLENIKGKLEDMSDAEIIEAMSDNALVNLSLNPESSNDNIYVLAAIERINRMQKNGEDTSDAIEALAKVGTTVGRMLRHFAELKTSSPIGIVQMVESAMGKAGRRMTDAQRQNLMKVAQKFMDAQRALIDHNKNLGVSSNESYTREFTKLSKQLDDITRTLNKMTGVLIPKKYSNLFGTFIKGNLMTPVSLVTNVVANVFEQLRFLVQRPVESVVGFASFKASRLISRYLGRDVGVQEYYGREFGVTMLAIPFALKQGALGFAQSVKGMFIKSGETNKVIHTGINPMFALYAMVSDTKLGDYLNKKFKISLIKTDLLPRTKEGKIKTSDRIKLLVEGLFGIAPDIVFRALSVGDLPFSRFSGAFVVYNEAVKKYGRSKIGTEEFKNFLMYPPKEVVQKMEKEGQRATFQEDNKAANSVLQFRKIVEGKGKIPGRIMGFLFDSFMPYIKTPANIFVATMKIAMPGIGTMSAMYNYSQGNHKKGNEDLSMAIVGSVMIKAADLLIAAGAIIGAFTDEDKEEKALQYAYTGGPMRVNKTAIQRYLTSFNEDSLKYQEGDVWIKIDKAGIIGVVMGARATATKDLDHGKKSKNNTWYSPGEDPMFDSSFILNFMDPQMVGSTFKFINSMSFLQGANSLLSLIAGDEEGYDLQRNIDNWFRSITSVALPNTISAVNRAQRQHMPIFRNKDIARRMQYIMLDKTFNVDGYPARIDMVGREILQTPPGKNPYYYHMVSVLKGQKVDPHPVIQEYYRLSVATGDGSWLPSAPSKLTSYYYTPTKTDLGNQLYREIQKNLEPGEVVKIRFKEEDLLRIQKIYYTELTKAVEEEIKKDYYINANDDEKVEMLEDIIKKKREMKTIVARDRKFGSVKVTNEWYKEFMMLVPGAASELLKQLEETE